MKYDDIVLPLAWVACIVSVVCWLMIMAGGGKLRYEKTILWAGYMSALGGLLFLCIYLSTK